MTRVCARLRHGPVLAAIIVLAAGAGCERSRALEVGVYVAGGDAARGERTIEAYGCGACHTIPGVARASGRVGPPLTGWARRGLIAGSLPNAPDNLIRWIMDPSVIKIGTAMPDLGVTLQQARDMASYLYTLDK